MRGIERELAVIKLKIIPAIIKRTNARFFLREVYDFLVIHLMAPRSFEGYNISLSGVYVIRYMLYKFTNTGIACVRNELCLCIAMYELSPHKPSPSSCDEYVCSLGWGLQCSYCPTIIYKSFLKKRVSIRYSTVADYCFKLNML